MTQLKVGLWNTLDELKAKFDQILGRTSVYDFVKDNFYDISVLPELKYTTWDVAEFDCDDPEATLYIVAQRLPGSNL
jgi:hypothetical protein